MNRPKIQAIKRDDQQADHPPEIAHENAAVDLSPFLGTWVNTFGATRSITRFVLTQANAGYTITAFAHDEGAASGHYIMTKVARPSSVH